MSIACVALRSLGADTYHHQALEEQMQVFGPRRARRIGRSTSFWWTERIVFDLTQNCGVARVEMFPRLLYIFHQRQVKHRHCATSDRASPSSVNQDHPPLDPIRQSSLYHKCETSRSDQHIDVPRSMQGREAGFHLSFRVSIPLMQAEARVGTNMFRVLWESSRRDKTWNAIGTNVRPRNKDLPERRVAWHATTPGHHLW